MTAASRPRAAARGFRIAAACLAAVLVTLSPSSPASAAVRPASATAAGKICVGLVIDDSNVGGSRTTGCSKVPPGSSGIDVLEAAGHTVVTQYNGNFVCSIDGIPASGCSGVDTSHYWAYWHRAPGGSSWTYSSTGAGSYQPPAGSTDAWVYDNGGNRRPGTVGRLCPPPGSETPSPSAPATSTGPPPGSRGRSDPGRSVSALRHQSPASAAPSPSGTGRTAPPRSGTPQSKRTKQPATDAGGRRADHRRRPPGSSLSATASPAPTAIRSTAVAAGAAVRPASGSGNGLWLVIVGVLAAAALGGAAWWRTRRSPP